MKIPAPFVCAAVVLAAFVHVPAQAQEVFAGVYAHGVDTPFTFETHEGGADLALGVRLDGLDALDFIGRPAPYAIASLNTRGDTSFAGGGLAWTIGKGPFYLRPAIGLVVHDGPERRVDPASRVRTDLGSRVLFEPEIGVGYRVTDRFSVEASWMHISQGQIFDSQQNPGIDMMGVRLVHRLR
jgi:lipid A 3-O-deacylase